MFLGNRSETEMTALFRNLRLHKIASNSLKVLSSLPPEDLTTNLKTVDLMLDSIPLQTSLGLIWDINADTFNYKFDNADKSFTRRGILSVVNGLYDPLGFLAPVIVQGKLFLRKVTALNLGWDDPVPNELVQGWILLERFPP